MDTAERDVRRKCRFRARGRGGEGNGAEWRGVEGRDTGVHVTAPTAFFSRVGNSFVEIVIADVCSLRTGLDARTV